MLDLETGMVIGWGTPPLRPALSGQQIDSKPARKKSEPPSET
jgi:hypothetical protein